MSIKPKKLGEILVEAGKITAAQIPLGLAVAKEKRLRIGHALMALGLVTSADVARALAVQTRLPYVETSTIDQRHLNLMPRDLMYKYLVIPIDVRNGKLVVMIHDPLDIEIQDNLRFRLNREIDVVIGDREAIKEFLNGLPKPDGDGITKIGLK